MFIALDKHGLVGFTVNFMWNAFILAVQLLTTLPTSLEPQSRLTARRSVAFFPLIGAMCGCVLAAIWTLGARFWSHQLLIAAALTLAASALISGGRYLGGLASAVDGLAAYGEGGDRTRPFAVMRDPRRGTSGIVALGAAIALKLAFLGGLSPNTVWPSLVVAGTLGRLATAFALSAFPLASAINSTDAETGRGLADAGLNEFLIATVFTILCLVVLPASGLLVMLIVCGLIGPIAQSVQRRLGGVSWALCNALGEVAELIALACLTIRI